MASAAFEGPFNSRRTCFPLTVVVVKKSSVPALPLPLKSSRVMFIVGTVSSCLVATVCWIVVKEPGVKIVINGESLLRSGKENINLIRTTGHTRSESSTPKPPSHQPITRNSAEREGHLLHQTDCQGNLRKDNSSVPFSKLSARMLSRRTPWEEFCWLQRTLFQREYTTGIISDLNSSRTQKQDPRLGVLELVHQGTDTECDDQAHKWPKRQKTAPSRRDTSNEFPTALRGK